MTPTYIDDKWRLVWSIVTRGGAGRDLRGADLGGADLHRAKLHEADLRGADLAGADLRGADLGKADLRGADLSWANLRGADLGEADLREARLCGADLRGADLRETDLRGADLEGADLRSTDLAGANLNAAELGLLFQSALAAGYEVGDWFDRARVGQAAVDALVGCLGSDSFRARAAAVAALGQLSERFVEPIIPLLTDDYPQVRLAAIRALERLRPDGAWRKHLKYECYVPAGPFLMGDDKSDQKDEKPAHEVALAAFYIGKYLVTNTDYKRYQDDVGQPFDIPPGKTEHPVVNVSWYDARDYAAWAGLRLLTEAEWEKAARGGREMPNLKAQDPNEMVKNPLPGRQYPWGDEFDQRKCNTYKSGIGGTTPVGQYSPAGDSPYGCADMAGNVWGWTSSLYKGYPYRADDGREDPASSDGRVLRGGCFGFFASDARCAARYAGLSYLRWLGRGVRVGVVAAPSSPISAL